MGTKNTPVLGFELEKTTTIEMGTRLESGDGTATGVQETRRVKTSRGTKQRIPNWGYFLFVVLAWVFVVLRIVHVGIEAASTEGRRRFEIFIAGAIVLLVMWAIFALRILLLI